MRETKSNAKSIFIAEGSRLFKNHVRRLQREDPTCRKYPCFKQHNGIAAMTIRLRNSPPPQPFRIEQMGRRCRCKLPFIVRERGSGTRKSIEALLGQQRHTLDQFNICATLGSSAAVKEAIKANLGGSIISRHAVRDELGNGNYQGNPGSGTDNAKEFLPGHFAETHPAQVLPGFSQETLGLLERVEL